MSYIEKQEYDAMYDMIDVEQSDADSKEQFVERNSKIYEGIGIKNLSLENVTLGEETEDSVFVSYNQSFDTVAGKISFINQASFTKTNGNYKLIWKDSLIFPSLEETDKVRVTTDQAERGIIKDRNGRLLASMGYASSVGFIPGKIQNREEAVKSLSELLGIDEGSINEKLDARWVEDDLFVPIATIPNVEELDEDEELAEQFAQETAHQDKLLEIPGVMITDVEKRAYKIGPATSNLLGYVQGVAEEDYDMYPDEDFGAHTVIGKSGVEKAYDKELRGKDGHEIKIIDASGNDKEVVIKSEKIDGEYIQLTIDIDMQIALYEQLKDDRGCSVAINPLTGEVLALVSTPAYDSNDFIDGMSVEQWTALSDDKNSPLYNRFQQSWTPGSTFKPIVAEIGLKTGAIDPDEDLSNDGLAWQKDASWGSYFVTTLQDYSPHNLENAIIYSDNIYFAKTALEIGADNFASSLDEIGFNQELPFDIKMAKSQYSNTGKIENEIQLADSGFGQGEILVNPLHMASIFTSFLNDGNILKPYLKYSDPSTPEHWIPQAFSSEAISPVMDGLLGAVNNPSGTAYAAHRGDIKLAGKTGSAEIKDSKGDTSGVENGWFAVFTADKDVSKPVLVVSMIENVQGLGGSGYVVEKSAKALDYYFEQEIQIIG